MSISPHERHAQAVGFAGLQVEALRVKIDALYAESEEVMSAIAMATGPDPTSPSAKAAGMSLLAVGEHLLTASLECRNTIHQLNDYSGSF